MYELVHARLVGLEKVVDLKCPELIVSKFLPGHLLSSVRQNRILDHLFGRSCNAVADSFLEVLNLSQSCDDFQELISTKRFVVVVVKVYFLEINSDERSINILSRQILVDYLPLFCAVDEIEPTNYGVILRVRYLIVELIF